MNTNLHRRTEKTPTDPLGTDAVRHCARAIMRSVGDVNMHPSIPTKVARAVVERQISPVEIAKLCDIIEAGRKAGRISNPGGYFLESARRIFRAADLVL